MNLKLHSKKRTYFFNYYSNEDGNSLVEVIESSKKKNAAYKRSKIVIFANDLPKIIKILQDLNDKEEDGISL